MTTKSRFAFASVALTAALSALPGMPVNAGTSPQTAVFRYQGVLKQGGALVNGSVDLQFALFDASSGGVQVAGAVFVNAVGVVDGVLSAPVDFTAFAQAFNGEARWLQIAVRAPAGSGNPFLLLSPRQQIDSVPYAAYALSSASLPATYSNAINFSNASNAFTGAHSGSGSGLTNLNASNLASGVLGSARLGGAYTNAVTFSNASNAFAGSFSGSGAALTSLNASNIATGNLASTRLPTGGGWPLTTNLTVDSGTLVIDPLNNFVGIGETAPARKLDLEGAANLTGSVGQMRVRDTANSIRSLEIGYQNSNTNAYLQTVKAAADTFYPRIALQPNGGNVGIGTTEPGRLLTVNGDGYFVDSVGIGVPASGARLEVRSNTEIPAIFNRGGNDGTLVSFYRGATSVGSISVSGILVSYNAFTGSHYGWSEREIERAALVRMTGENRRMPVGEGDVSAFHGEIIYGIEACSVANDPACLGAHLARLNPSQPASDANPRLVMAVGNGEMWVTQSSAAEQGIRAGEYLISSDVEGCAMRDDAERFAVGYIVARAAETVDWAAIEPDEADGGVKRARISVLFESFVRDSRSAAAHAPNASSTDHSAIIAQLQQRNDELEERILALEQTLQALISQKEADQ